MKISAKGLELIKNSEGCELLSYTDLAGVWTIGYGYTGMVYGRKIGQGMTITQEQADALLLQTVEYVSHHVAMLLTVTASQGQFDALVDFAYNVGLQALTNSTLLKLLNNGCTEMAALEFKKWDHVKGKKIHGLTIRRSKEFELFNTQEKKQ